MVIFSIGRTSQRENLFNWVGPIAKTQTIFYAKKGSRIALDSLEDAKKVRSIGVIEDWFSTQNLEAEGFENLDASSLPTEVVEKLMSGQVTIAPFVDATVKEIVEEAGYTMDDVEPIFVIDVGYNYIGISKGTSKKIVREWQNNPGCLLVDTGISFIIVLKCSINYTIYFDITMKTDIKLANIVKVRIY